MSQPHILRPRAATDFEPLETGDPVAIGQYRLTGKLRPGGRAVAAYIGASPDPTSGPQRVLIKVYVKSDVRLRAGITQDITQLHRVSSPFVARVLGVIEADTAFAVIREFVPGVSLDQIIDRHADGLELVQLWPVVDGSLESLATIHAKDVVHGAIKPSNIIVGERPVLVDLQLVEPKPGAPWHAGERSAQRFESPEHDALRPLTPASDVYSWAMVILAASGGIQFHVDDISGYTKPDTDIAHRKIRPLLDQAVRELPLQRRSSAELFGDLRRTRRPGRDVQISEIFPSTARALDDSLMDDFAELEFGPQWVQSEWALAHSIVRARDGKVIALRRLLIGLGASWVRFAALLAVAALASLPAALAIEAVIGMPH